MEVDTSIHSERSYDQPSFVEMESEEITPDTVRHSTGNTITPVYRADKLAKMFHRKQSLKDSFLSSEAMRATSNSMALVNSVLGFDIVELWCQDIDNSFTCTYVHASEEVLIYPIIYGHYPGKSKDHKHSPMVSSGIMYFFVLLAQELTFYELHSLFASL